MLRLFKSSAFQLTMLYIGMFGASVAVLILFLYLFMEREFEDQIKHNVNIQLADLGRKFVLYGTGETISSIEHLIKNGDGTALYMLIDPEWKVVAGNLEKWPGGSTTTKDWLRFNYEKYPDKFVKAVAINSTLPEGYILLVGSTMESIDKLGETMRDWMIVIIGITFVMAITGGVIITLNINSRIETINQVCRMVIMSGELDKRVKVLGSGDAFDKLGNNFNTMMGRISELVDGIRYISASVAHDLRTPLNRLRQRLENIHEYDSANFEDVGKAIEEVDNLVETFDAILRISQAESGAGREGFEEFDLSQVVNDVAELYSAVADEKNINFMSKIDKNIKIMGDRHLIVQALANLIDNALKYTPVKGKVEVGLKADKDVIIWVADNGAGIPEKFRSKATEKFFRLEESRNTPGSGLGLSLAKAAFNLHDGEIRLLDNNPGLRVECVIRV